MLAPYCRSHFLHPIGGIHLLLPPTLWYAVLYYYPHQSLKSFVHSSRLLCSSHICSNFSIRYFCGPYLGLSLGQIQKIHPPMTLMYMSISLEYIMNKLKTCGFSLLNTNDCENIHLHIFYPAVLQNSLRQIWHHTSQGHWWISLRNRLINFTEITLLM